MQKSSQTKGSLSLALACFLAMPFSSTVTAGNSSQPHCDTLKTIMQSSVSNFEAHRSEPQSFNQFTTWKTELTQSGQECQVWQWGSDTSLVCSRSFPTREAGQSFFHATNNTLKACLQDVHVQDRSAVLADEGLYTYIRTNADKRNIDVFLSKNNGLLREVWTLHFMVAGADGHPVRFMQSALRNND